MDTGVLNTSDGNAIQTEKYIVGSTTRDLTLASGTQAVTGLGFKPLSVILMGAVSTVSGRASFGIDDGTNHSVVPDWQAETANSWQPSNGSSIRIATASAVEQNASITTLDVDGFTLTWTKIGAASGIFLLKFLAFK